MRDTRLNSSEGSVAGAIIVLGLVKWVFWLLFMMLWIWPILSWIERIVQYVTR